MLTRDSIILVTGTTGMVGAAVYRLLKKKGIVNILTPSRVELDLCDSQQVDSYFRNNTPEYVFLIAAKVGGISANQNDPVGFLDQNIRMQLYLLEACHKYKTTKNLFLGSSCVYPRECPQPMKEEYLLSGPLEPTNEGYALAKIAGLKLAKYYYEQYGMLTICPMPCNIYGQNDHFSFARSHVLPALVKRFVDAVEEGTDQVTLWGSGTARREFMHVDDVAQALYFLMCHYNSPDIINVGTGQDLSIHELATLIAQLVSYKGEIRWDRSKPDGMPQKCLDTTRLTELGFQPQIPLTTGIENMIADYRRQRIVG